MADDSSFPSIDPSFFDLIVVGTGLPESVIAAASSAADKSVLHVDPNSFYGSHYSSLPIDDFVSFIESQSSVPPTTAHSPPPSSSSYPCDHVALDFKSRCLYSDVDVYCPGSSQDLGPSRKFSLDLAGPRVFFCADSAVDLMLKSGASHHIEFKSIEASFIYSGSDGKLSSVPDSRSAIFKDRSLTLTEKNQLMRFFKLVQEHFELAAAATASEENRRISNEDLDSPFVDFLNKHQRLPPKIKSIILYAIAMADYDQDSPNLSKEVIKTKDGIESLALFHSSVGRFTNALGALIYPIYGQGELPQAFCRCAAVKGALYVLRMPVSALLVEKETNVYKGVKLKSGQEIFSHQLVMGPSFTALPPSVQSSFADLQQESSSLGKVKRRVARAICITKGSIKADVSNLLVVFPPRSLHAEQIVAVRALQLSSSLAVCPSGLFVLYLSALCEDASQGKELLRAAMNAILARPSPGRDENSDPTPCESTEGQDGPTLLWRIMYIQELTEGSAEVISSCPMPDGSLDCRKILESTMQLFHKIYPEEEFFPEKEAVEDAD